MRDSLVAAFASLMSHAAVVAGLSGEPGSREPSPREQRYVELALEAPQPVEPAVPDEAVAETPEPAPAPRPRIAPRIPPPAAPARRAAREPVPVVEAPLPSAPLDLGGLTLSAPSGWSAGQSAGGSAGGEGPPGQAIASESAPLRPARERLVLARDLGQRPRQPERLAAGLDRLYPEDARRQGIEGRALVRVRIRASGRAEPMNVVRESYAGFGAACRQLLRGSTWGPGRDNEGRRVDTIIEFPCVFEVRP